LDVSSRICPELNSVSERFSDLMYFHDRTDLTGRDHSDHVLEYESWRAHTHLAGSLMLADLTVAATSET
jgi:hypothetical protein